ncbi:MAG: Asp-tRNA(Asn)/Glu-tRNA(Gln) amidotransferase subunit GatA [bacterium]|nr:Asp-tRNA(Asn)/Glu-tRNA(Gln) amidotransferase subunit GatA [bacterium]
MSFDGPAARTAAAVRAGERSATSAVAESLAAIDAAGELGAFNAVTADAALARAEAIDDAVAAGDDPGPLAGAPVALKDNICTRGVPTTCSSRILEGWVPPYDATVVDLLGAAGAVIVGKTNMDEFAMGSSTENSAFGPTRNPLDPERVPGGSSGGSAASVAGGLTPLALASDTGGSIRQPAALCGIVGMKPTYGRVSRYGLVAFASSLDQIGPMARTVGDAALLYSVIAGCDPLDSTSVPEPLGDLNGALAADVDGLRVGIVSELSGEGIDGDVLSRLDAAATALTGAGAYVGEVSVPAAVYGLSAYFLIAPAEASSNLARYDGVRYGLRVPAAGAVDMNVATRTTGFGDEVKRRIMLGTFVLSAGYYDAYYAKALQVRTLVVRDFAAAYERFDVLLAPTSPSVAFRFGERTADPLTMYLSDACTVASNLAGHPAVSVPFGSGADGLPVGVQVMAPALGEDVMFRAAAALERLLADVPRPDGAAATAAAKP